MNYTQQNPMPIGIYKLLMVWRWPAYILLLFTWVAVFTTTAWRSISALFIPDENVWTYWLTTAISLVLAIVIYNWLENGECKVNNQWHLFRGTIVTVGMDGLIKIKEESKWMPVTFRGDKAYTGFAGDEYRANKGVLREGSTDVLIVRRSTTFGSNAYEGAMPPRK